MKRIPTYLYKCDFCGKNHRSKGKCLQHEVCCRKNPDRIPYMGELTFIDEVQDLRLNDAEMVCKCVWIDPPKWWPAMTPKHGLGMMFVGLGWVHIDGWYPGEYDQDIWPRVNGKDLWQLRTWERLDWYFETEGGICRICGKEMDNDRHICARCHEVIYGFPCKEQVFHSGYEYDWS